MAGDPTLVASITFVPGVTVPVKEPITTLCGVVRVVRVALVVAVIVAPPVSGNCFCCSNRF